MNQGSYNYGILVQNALVKELVQKSQNQRTALLGTIVKIEGVLGNRTFAIRFLKDDLETWETSKFCCDQAIVVSVNESFWPYLAAVSSPQERVKLAKNPARCEQLMMVSHDNVVGFSDFGQVLLGTVKYIGNIKGMGKGFGMCLHEKKINNRCSGTCAGISYFDCPPGFGVFTTVERIILQNTPSMAVKTVCNGAMRNLLDDFTEKNIVHFSMNANECEIHKKGRGPSASQSLYKNQIQVQMDPEGATENGSLNKHSTNFKSSLSLQDILESSHNLNIGVNTNNDFHQTATIQSDDVHLTHENCKQIDNNRHKSEIDLIDAIGGSWAGSTETKDFESYSNLRKALERPQVIERSLHNEKNTSQNFNNALKSVRNKSVNPVSHLINGSKTVPRKSKLLQENVSNKDVIGNNNKATMASKNKSSHFLTLQINPKRTNKAKPLIYDILKGAYNLDIYDHLPLSVVEINRSNNDPKIPSSVQYNTPPTGTMNDLSVGMLVEISNDISEEPLYGVIRWMGVNSNSKQVLVGIELEEEQAHLPLNLTDGIYDGRRFFKCAENRGIFVPLNQCHKDGRFVDGTPIPAHIVPDKMFGKEMDCPIVKGSVAPLCMPTEEDVEAVCGKFRGIQGHHNSCYLDATLFAMFTFTAVFDSLLFRPKGPDDISHYEEVQRVLREEIINPLRTNLFVRADRVMNLRKLLDQLSSVSGLTSEEKDPEEFLNSLLAQILKAEPFLKLNSGQEAYHYQLFVEKDDGLTLPSVQQLFEQSFLTSDIKLKEVPSCLIIQMPRFGKSYKMYPRIVPSQLLDVTDIIENSPRQCTVCGKLAKWECKQCFGECGAGLESTAFCTQCMEKAHSHSRRTSHKPVRLAVSHDFSIMAEHCHPPRLFMELFAVICIETSHYVAFVKCGVGHEAPWCFFDSMADRKGEQNGYNIPEMVACPDVSKWLSDEQACRMLHENAPMDRYLPEHARRLLCDAYICMYQSPDVMMYR